MFDDVRNTPEVENYLNEEAVALDRLFRALPDRNHLIEVGCGHGRYRPWAAERDLNYDGLDLVAALVDAGRKLHVPTRPDLRSKLHIESVEELGRLFEHEGLQGHGNRVITIFPFNCFGNLARPSMVLRALAHTQASALVSTYSTDPETTNLRITYYEQCHYSGLVAQDLPKGVVIRSREGLRAYAYREEYLTRLFAAVNYRLEMCLKLDRIGIGYFFVPQEDAARPR